uniref:Uncharacterized protein n=1 Tax=Leptobrachium leishanense TaxID=445787 RepID=A0A8C5M521_9ANUR
MEQPAVGDVAPGPPASSFQARLWRNLQLGKSRRSAGRSAAGTPGFTGFRRKRQALDRVFSSSQPNLCCSGADSLPASAPCSSPSLAKEPPAGAKDGQHASCSAHGAHQLSHQKSSSLPGTDCLEQLLVSDMVKSMLPA